ncbi:enoyl-ACP reductase FabI [Streptomyces bambusae]|uniref:enoyl-ACP reductase FabI n=1 Tax=Streptomyces bambusae TaxID=1550616 RepID=UPI001CFE2055|nr:enoyl-ACP reductase FabI [Streptomyces bambusae]MCB5166099.1 enoyl-ACP reductase FabI [Streptomyces bambusae]
MTEPTPTPTGLLAGKTVLITGVLTERSIAFQVARTAQEQGARVLLTGYGRLSLVERVARRLPRPAPVIELDVTDDEHLATLETRIRAHTDRLDGVLHAIAHAPPGALGGGFLTTTRQDATTAFEVSTVSLQALTTAVLPLLTRGSSVVALDFDSRQVWAGYDWMGVAKAGLEACARYLAAYLGPRGIRVNLVAAGPLRTTAALATYTADTDPHRAEQDWHTRAPLGWSATDYTPVAKACTVLLSDWLPATTGEILHVDGGTHTTGDPTFHAH